MTARIDSCAIVSQRLPNLPGDALQGERQVNSYQHAAQASVFRDSLTSASCFYLGKLHD